MDLSTAVRSGDASITALDQDEESLAVVHREYAKFGVNAVPASVRHILVGRVKLPASDLSYTAGPYDYLTEPVATRLTTLMFDALRPGGTLLLANFLPDIPDVGYMESLMDWHLIYRDDAEMRALLAGVPPGEIAGISQFHDPFENITFMRCGGQGSGRGPASGNGWSQRDASGIVRRRRGLSMKHFTAVIERDGDTGLYVGWVPGFAGAHSQGATLDELQANLQEVVEMLLEDGEPRIESVFIGTQTVEVA